MICFQYVYSINGITWLCQQLDELKCYPIHNPWDGSTPPPGNARLYWSEMSIPCSHWSRPLHRHAPSHTPWAGQGVPGVPQRPGQVPRQHPGAWGRAGVGVSEPRGDHPETRLQADNILLKIDKIHCERWGGFKVGVAQNVSKYIFVNDL